MPSLYHNDDDFMSDRNTTWLSQRIVTYDIHGRARTLTFRQSISPCEKYFKHLGPFGTASLKQGNGSMHQRRCTRRETKFQETPFKEAKLKDSTNMRKRRQRKKLEVMTICEEKNEETTSTINKSIQPNRRTSSVIFMNERRISTGQFVGKHDDHHVVRESDLSILGDENTLISNDTHFEEGTILSSRSEDTAVNHSEDRLRRTSRSSGTGSLLDLSQRSPRISRDNTAPLSKEGRLQHGKSYQNIYGQHAGKKGQRGKSRGAKLRTTMSVESLVLVDPLARFRRAVRTVQILMRAATSNRQDQQRTQAKLLSWSQFQDDIGTSKRMYDRYRLSFDRNDFKAKQENHISNEGRSILSMDPSNRSPEQLRLALIALSQTVEAFGEFPVKMQESLVRVGWYENFAAKRMIIRQGHKADNFYLILSGTAVVTILDKDKETGEPFIHTAAFLNKGNTFGELALMHGAKRSASVTCKDNVELLAVSREDFIDIFMPVEKNRVPEHIQFLHNIELLKDWPIDKLPYNNPKICLTTYFRRGSLLCRDSNDSEWIYVMKTGTCRVLKSLIPTKANIPGLEDQVYQKQPVRVTLPPIIETQNSGHREVRKKSRQCRPSSHRSKATKKIPHYRERSINELNSSAEEHMRAIQDIYEKRHIKRGLEQVAFNLLCSTTSTSLVSDGAECILISKKFFLQHLSDEAARRLRQTIQPLPSDTSLQEKLQNQANWEAYKTMTVNNHIWTQRQMNDTLFY